MYQTVEEFNKSTQAVHAMMVADGEKMNLDAYRDTIAKSLGYADVAALEASIVTNYQPSFVLVYMWQGITDSIRTYKANASGNAQMLEDFADKVKDRLNVLPDGSVADEDKDLFDEAMETLFYEDSKITVTCYQID